MRLAQPVVPHFSFLQVTNKTSMSDTNTITSGLKRCRLEEEDRVTRATRLLEESTRRVKKARRQARKDQLQLQFLETKKQLDLFVLRVFQLEEELETCVPRFKKNKEAFLESCRDKRQLQLMKLVRLEEAILDDESDDEEE